MGSTTSFTKSPSPGPHAAVLPASHHPAPGHHPGRPGTSPRHGIHAASHGGGASGRPSPGRWQPPWPCRPRRLRLITRAHATSIGHAAQAHTGSVRRQLVRLSTSTADDLGEILMRDGLDRSSALETQKTREKPVGFKITSAAELLYPADNPHHLDFNGAMGAYYREMYLHIPWLIARALRAEGKYQDALSWYRRICDFTAHDSEHDTRPGDRPWRYIEFRDLTVPKLKAMLTDKAAINAYEADPFNPHAIARLRPSAYQRAIVMEIIGTYHDLGDSLFAQDTMESVNEASLYYHPRSRDAGAAARPARQMPHRPRYRSHLRETRPGGREGLRAAPDAGELGLRQPRHRLPARPPARAVHPPRHYAAGRPPRRQRRRPHIRQRLGQLLPPIGRPPLGMPSSTRWP